MNHILYALVPWDEAIKNEDGSFTTVEIRNNNNQLEADKVTKVIIKGKEYLIVK